MERISEARLRNIASEKGRNLLYMEKDYFLTVLLYCMRGLDGMYLKGGTALNKVFFDHLRLSEDLDFTVEREIGEIRKQVEGIVDSEKAHFQKVESGRQGRDFARLKVFYNGYFARGGFISIDLNRLSSVHLGGERKKVMNFYGLDFEANVLNFRELATEKMRAAITRNQPRDYFDMFYILKDYELDMWLVKKKTEEAGERFGMERIFKNARKIYSSWDEEIGKLTNEKLTFLECIRFLEEKLREKE